MVAGGSLDSGECALPPPGPASATGAFFGGSQQVFGQVCPHTGAERVRVCGLRLTVIP